MAQTIAEKILARAAGRQQVRPGEIVTCRVDLAMFHDSSGPRRVAPRLEYLGARVWDPSRVVVVSDHYVPAVDAESARILKLTRDWVKANEIEHFYDMQGICHVVLPEHGHLQPGMFVAGGDSHSTTGGAFGCYMAGFGATDMTGVMVTGEIWMTVPETILVELGGELAGGVVAKDIMLHLAATLGMGNNFKVIEYAGTAVAAMAMDERMVLTNMAAELGAETGIIAPDATTLEAIAATGQAIDEKAAEWTSDPAAEFSAHHKLNLADLAPQVAAPHSPANSRPIDDVGSPTLDQCYIGACVGAKLSDLRMAATILRGRKVAKDTRLLVAPASAKITAQAAAEGTLAAIAEAGGIILGSGCGACAGLGAGLLADGEVCVSTTNRNFRGRMGSPAAEVFLASPYTVAASAIEGRIADPRQHLPDAS